MNALQSLIVQAKAAASHIAEPAYRRAAAIDACAFEENGSKRDHSLNALLALMKALPEINDPCAIREHGAAIYSIASAIHRTMPKPEPRRYWREGAGA
jgi:hypothetical protein